MVRLASVAQQWQQWWSDCLASASAVQRDHHHCPSTAATTASVDNGDGHYLSTTPPPLCTDHHNDQASTPTTSVNDNDNGHHRHCASTTPPPSGINSHHRWWSPPLLCIDHTTTIRHRQPPSTMMTMTATATTVHQPHHHLSTTTPTTCLPPPPPPGISGHQHQHHLFTTTTRCQWPPPPGINSHHHASTTTTACGPHHHHYPMLPTSVDTANDHCDDTTMQQTVLIILRLHWYISYYDCNIEFYSLETVWYRVVQFSDIVRQCDTVGTAYESIHIRYSVYSSRDCVTICTVLYNWGPICMTVATVANCSRWYSSAQLLMDLLMLPPSYLPQVPSSKGSRYHGHRDPSLQHPDCPTIWPYHPSPCLWHHQVMVVCWWVQFPPAWPMHLCSKHWRPPSQSPPEQTWSPNLWSL